MSSYERSVLELVARRMSVANWGWFVREGRSTVCRVDGNTVLTPWGTPVAIWRDGELCWVYPQTCHPLIRRIIESAISNAEFAGGIL